MKILMVNGSAHKNGCTRRALDEAAESIRQEGIDTDFFWIGNKAIPGCLGCYKCTEIKKCVYNDVVNEFTGLAEDYDGFVFGSPVYYSGMNGSLMSFMDRIFFSSMNKDQHPFMFKPAAGVVSARRAGTTVALDQINKYFIYHQMPLCGSRYWCMVHGQTPEEVEQDAEGLQIMRILGKNMAWLVKLIENGKENGIEFPRQEETRIRTNFVR